MEPVAVRSSLSINELFAPCRLVPLSPGPHQVSTMPGSDYDDPQIEARWLAQQRENVAAYLSRQAVRHNGVATAPDWFVAPYVSLWPVVSGITPPATGWWAIAGDLPTDYLSSLDAADARQAMREFARRWRTAAESMQRGEQPSDLTFGVGDEWPALGALLESRATILWNWSGDDSLWTTGD